jgi:hypothetical protein
LRLSPARGARTALLILALSVCTAAQTLTGVVTNGTTNKPSSGDEVVLIKLTNGMEEAARTKSDSEGKFSFQLDDPNAPHLIRAIHQGVTYHSMAPPGTTSVKVPVYEVVKRLEGIGVTADVMRIQAESNQLEVVRLFAVNNSSSPAKTQMNDHNFEFYLPQGAKIVQSMAKTANGQPINSAPVPQAEKNRYAFIFPLRPGETEFQVAYQLPYPGSASLDPKSLYPMEHFVVMTPKSMQFTPGPNTSYQSMQDPQQKDAIVQVATQTRPGQPLSFTISGIGMLEGINAPGESASSSGGGEGISAENDSRPGGGLGPPIDAPDPLQKYRWYIIGGFALVLAGGATYVAKRQPPAAVTSGSGSAALNVQIGEAAVRLPAVKRPSSANATAAGPPTNPAVSVPPTGIPAGSSMLMEGLKEELFQLELEHKQGQISQPEYEKAKAALDATLERALRRQAQKS